MLYDIVTCDCGQKNRVPALLESGKKAICATCKADLETDDANGDDEDGEGGVSE